MIILTSLSCSIVDGLGFFSRSHSITRIWSSSLFSSSRGIYLGTRQSFPQKFWPALGPKSSSKRNMCTLLSWSQTIKCQSSSFGGYCFKSLLLLTLIRPDSLMHKQNELALLLWFLRKYLRSHLRFLFTLERENLGAAKLIIFFWFFHSAAREELRKQIFLVCWCLLCRWLKLGKLLQQRCKQLILSQKLPHFFAAFSKEL